MSVITSETFERGTAGAACTGSNTVFSSLMQNWTFQNLPAALTGGGTLCGHPVSSGGTAIAQKTITATAVMYSRWYVYLTSYPPSALSIDNPGTGAGSVGDVQITTTGQAKLRNSSFVQIALSPAIPRNTWVRIERYYNNTAGNAELWLYSSDPNATAADYDSGLLSATTGGSIAQLQLGIINSSTWSGLYIDNYATDNAAKVGPVVTGTPPTLTADKTAGVEPGATVTLTATEHGGTGLTLAQTGGTTVTLTGAGAARTFTAPPTLAGDTLTFTATDSAGTSSPVTVATLPAPVRLLRGGTWHAGYLKVY